MAQALFDEHPLESYLRHAGEVHECMPGSSADIELELDPMAYTETEEEAELDEMEWRPVFLIQLLELFNSTFSLLQATSQSSPFIERFKYDVISSSLLAVSLPSAHGRTTRSAFPGHLDHSRTPSLASQLGTSLSPPAGPSPETTPSYLIPSLTFAFAVVLFNAGHIFLALVCLGASMYTLNMMNRTSKHDMTPSLESLDELIVANNQWESAVQEAISIIETDERSTPFGSVPSSPSTVRVSLHSTLLTTQTQCDNIRHLFSALTSPSELSQLSEMYAPPSPSPVALDALHRPLSLPARRRTFSMPNDQSADQVDKRSTWSGTYTTKPGNPASPNLLQRREKRRSDLASIFRSPGQPSSSRSTVHPVSAPVTPFPVNPLSTLVDVREESDAEGDDEHTFAAAALDLQRKRKSAGLEAFRMPNCNVIASSPVTPASTLSSGSRLTPIQSTRHPLSSTALDLALQSALASKRYASAHLLALRFSEDEDEGYWEDVRSVMSLLTSALSDASSRLEEALEDAEKQKERDANPTPSLNASFSPVEEELREEAEPSETARNKRVSLSEDVSFAPMPSLISRFASHVDAIMTALDDSRDHLEDCVRYLRDDSGNPVTSAKRKRRSHPPMALSDSDNREEHPAMQAYDRLRKELGMALRECERGRERLLDIVYPRSAEAEDDEDSADDLPALGHDASDESDKPEPDTTFPFEDEAQLERSAVYPVVASQDADPALDDASAHLLLSASSQHLPPPGIEQIFEADTSAAPVFTRERSKLSREERIRLVKARRESGGGGVFGLGIDLSAKAERPGVEKWGPGGDVVQELKDVIWKVGEKRRKMASLSSDEALLRPSNAQ